MIIIWIAVVILESLRHLFIIHTKERSPNKRVSFIARALIAAVLILIELKTGPRPIEVLILAYLFSGWFLHDTFLAMGMGRKPWYLNSTGTIDKAQASIGPAAWALKGLGFLGTVSYYFVNYA